MTHWPVTREALNASSIGGSCTQPIAHCVALCSALCSAHCNAHCNALCIALCSALCVALSIALCSVHCSLLCSHCNALCSALCSAHCCSALATSRSLCSAISGCTGFWLYFAPAEASAQGHQMLFALQAVVHQSYADVTCRVHSETQRETRDRE